jgi:hypothetical protein
MDQKQRQKRKAQVRTGSLQSKSSSKSHLVYPEPILPDSDDDFKPDPVKTPKPKRRGRSPSPEYGTGKVNRSDPDIEDENEEAVSHLQSSDSLEGEESEVAGSGGYPGYGQSSAFSTPPGIQGSNASECSSGRKSPFPPYKLVKRFDCSDGTPAQIYTKIETIMRGELAKSGWPSFKTDDSDPHKTFAGWKRHHVSTSVCIYFLFHIEVLQPE